MSELERLASVYATIADVQERIKAERMSREDEALHGLSDMFQEPGAGPAAQIGEADDRCVICLIPVSELLELNRRIYRDVFCACTGYVGIYCEECIVNTATASPDQCMTCRQPWNPDTLEVVERRVLPDMNEFFEQNYNGARHVSGIILFLHVMAFIRWAVNLPWNGDHLGPYLVERGTFAYYSIGWEYSLAIATVWCIAWATIFYKLWNGMTQLCLYLYFMYYTLIGEGSVPVRTVNILAPPTQGGP